MKRFNSLSRRDLIKQTAAVAGAGTLSASMVERALAADTNFKRVIVWYVPEGCAQQAFWPRNTGNLVINEAASINGKNPQSKGSSIRGYVDANQATYCLQPLKKHEADISLYSGFKNNGADADDPHKQVVNSALTGSKTNEGSIDQILGKKLQGSSPVPSIYSAIWGHHVHNRGANDDYLSPVRKVGGGTTGSSNWNPMETYKFVFGNDGIPAPSGGSGAIPYGERQTTVQILKAMEARLEAIKCVGGAQAHSKYETLLASYTKLEKETSALLLADEEAAKNNGPDVRFPIPNNWLNTNGTRTDLSKYWNKPENFEKLMDIAIQTTVASFALDRTRVSMMQFSGSGTDKGPVARDHYRKIGVPGLEAGDVNDHYLGHDPDPKRRRNQARIFRWYYSKLSQLIDQLKAVPDGSGTLFDSTLIVTASEFSMYNHRSNDMPYMICGNGGGAFKTGQYLDARSGGSFRNSADFFYGVTEGLGANLNHFGTSTNAYRGMLV
ncbi:DUF1552 domain-containing protein [Marinagarivorans algicola]|uniref:DUF1552 domain-containing protein n=1 Tax=Marinagarivorans algicola TaxID=1513270 RepID=UPI0006B4CEDF|nr:DUF1552 domain-containing protein [Marinagarivorans algicola]